MKNEWTRKRFIETTGQETLTTNDSRARVPACRSAPTRQYKSILGSLTKRGGAADAN
jgi:hypothetical protein